MQLYAQKAGTCKLRNPWGETRVRIRREGGTVEEAGGRVFELDVRPGEQLLLTCEDGENPPERLTFGAAS